VESDLWLWRYEFLEVAIFILNAWYFLRDGGTTVGGLFGNVTLQKQPIVYSYYANNITITGGGTIDGNGPLWYACLTQNNKHDKVAPCYPYGRQCLLQKNNKLNNFRPRLVQLTHSTNIVVDNIKLKDSPFWTLHLANTTNVHATNLHITTPRPDNYVPKRDGMNTDGVDIDCSVNVTVENSYIQTGK
jgi:polygalacturonase